MKEHGLILTKDNRLASVEGRKTQTRRIINHVGNSMHFKKLLCDWGMSEPPQIWDGKDPYDVWNWTEKKPPKAGDWVWPLQCEVDDHATWPLKPPYQVGDLLWMKEPLIYKPEQSNFYYADDSKGVGVKL